MRTYVYIDGFNLYYRALKKTPYRWLDLKKLVNRIIKPTDHILTIKYFTARVKQTAWNPNIHIRQQTYIRAIEAFIPEVDVYYGTFKTRKKPMRRVFPTPTERFALVYKTEEKGSDVNLGTHLVNDAAHGRFDLAILVSNDVDLAEALRIAREDWQKGIGVVPPQNPIVDGLRKQAHFFKYIRKDVLRDCQLPDPIPNTSIRKPPRWDTK